MNQPPTPTLSKGLDLKMMLAGLAVVGIGVAALAVGLFTSYGLRLGPLPIPLSLVGPVIAAVGGVAMYLSTSQLKCDACRVPLTLFTAWFPVEDEAVVVEALHHDPARLQSLGMGSPSTESVEVSLEACERCQRVGSLKYERLGSNAPAVEQTVTGPRVAELLTELQRRSALHEQRYEEAVDEG